MRALLLSALFASPAAFAAGFDDVDAPMTTTFNFEWTGYAPGATTFTFYAPTSGGLSTSVCNAMAAVSGTDWCFSGDFSTGNSGIGTYSTRVLRRNCSTNTLFLLLGTIQTQTCDVDQRLTAIYDYTSVVANPAQYQGFATVGEANRSRGWFIWQSQPAWPAYEYDQVSAPGYFSGDLSGPASGVFCESPLTCP